MEDEKKLKRAAYLKKYAEENKERIREHKKKYREANKEKIEEYRQNNRTQANARERRRLYGLTDNDYETMLQHQNYRCLVCGCHADSLKTQSRQNQKLHIDHCHESGKVRGLLCFKCNLALGHLRESPEITKCMLEYIQTRCL